MLTARTVSIAYFAIWFAISQTLSGCAPVGVSQKSGNGGDTDSSSLSTVSQALICIAGGAAGFLAGKALAKATADRNGQKISSQELDKRAKAYSAGLALAFCAGSVALGNSIYSKLSQEGRKSREAAVQQAIASSKTKTYRDPSNPTLGTGTVTTSPRYTETAANRICTDVEDRLKTEQIYQKYCQNPESGEWTVVT